MSTTRRFSARRPISSPKPVADTPPFFEPIRPEEIFLYGKPTAWDATAKDAGWTVARFLITGPGGASDRQTVVGYVRRGLAAYIVKADGVRMAFLIHLNTGHCISRTLDDALILFIADILDPLVPWETADQDAVQAAGATYLPALEATGLRCVKVQIFQQTTLAWIRASETLARAKAQLQEIEGGRR